jgi:hypothetical protein
MLDIKGHQAIHFLNRFLEIRVRGVPVSWAVILIDCEYALSVEQRALPVMVSNGR